MLIVPVDDSLISEVNAALTDGIQGNWNDVRAFSTKHLSIRASRPKAVNLDSELTAKTPVTFDIREKAILVFVP